MDAKIGGSGVQTPDVFASLGNKKGHQSWDFAQREAGRLRGLLRILIVFALFAHAATAESTQLRLQDSLDFPGEGYCVDVLGVGASARADLPLVVHNCLPRRGSADRIVTEREGRLYMPAFDACVTAFGVRVPLPGSAVVLRPCDGDESFLPAGNLQRFEWTDDSELRLLGTDLCLTVGEDAAATFSSTHRWRVLSMEPCGAERQIWQRPN